MSTLFSIGQMNQLGDAFEAHGLTPEDVTKLRSHPDFAMLRLFARGQAKLVLPQHLIDCDAAPFQPNGWSVEKHIKAGQFEWNPTKVKLYLAKSQKPGKLVEGNKLRKELEGQLVLNANVLDYLLAHPELIPDEWKGKAIFFWGTIYRNADGHLFVRYLCWVDGGWDWGNGWLGNGFVGSGPAAVSASI
ncbi:MAG: hypothetical protein WC687_05055 [Patescibacteria group bacterium]|jgi:hypothetical protein